MKFTTKVFVGALMLCYALILGLLAFFPSDDTASVAIGLCFVGIFSWILFYRRPWFSMTGAWIVLAAATMSLCAVVINLNYFTVAAGADVSSPVLLNYDACRDWSWALSLAFGAPAPDAPLREFSYPVAGLLWLFGRSVTVPLLFCSACYIGTVIITGGIAWRLTNNRYVTNVAMAFIAAMCFLFAQSAVLIKDCPVTFFLAVIIYTMTRWITSPPSSRSQWITTGAVMAAACTALAFSRASTLLMVVAACVIYAAVSGRQIFIPLGITAAVALTLWATVNYIVLPQSLSVALTVEAHPASMIILQSETSAPLDNITGNYTTLPFYRKLLLLPLTMAVQFLLPFPWGFSRHIMFGPSQAVAHFGFPWYFVGALAVYWLFTRRARADRPLMATLLLGIILSALTAYISSGRVARYCLPFLPMIVPAAAATAVYYRRHRSLWIWLGIFSILLAATLVVCYKMQMAS